MSVTVRVRSWGLAILVLVSITACKSRESAVNAPATTGTASAPEEVPVAVVPVPEQSSENNAAMNSLYEDDFSGEWPVDAPSVTLICEKLPSGGQALTATVEGTIYALNDSALEVADGGGVQELKAVAKEGTDSAQMINLFTQEATALCDRI